MTTSNPEAASVALWVIVFGFLLLALVQGGFTFFSGTLAAHTAEGITQRLRNFLSGSPSAPTVCLS